MMLFQPSKKRYETHEKLHAFRLNRKDQNMFFLTPLQKNEARIFRVFQMLPMSIAGK